MRRDLESCADTESHGRAAGGALAEGRFGERGHDKDGRISTAD